MDVLSDVLLSVRLTGAVFFAVDAAAPFVTESPSVRSMRDSVLPGAEQVIAFHVVTEGSCWAETIGHDDAPVSLVAGDMVAFPGGEANVMASAPGMRGRPDPALYVRPPDRALPFAVRMSLDSAADRTRFVCGFLGCDTRPFNPLLDSLPHIVRSPVSPESRQWVASLLDAAVQTSGGEAGAGREAMLAKLAELMFVEALRSHLARMGDGERGWLAGVRDPQVGAALKLMHGRPAAPWTLERLAREVGMSRSSFADRFTNYVRIPPMQYLARWRLQLAARMLESGPLSVGRVASAVGYQSEAAFHRAFKRAVGEAPGAWRRGQDSTTSAHPTDPTHPRRRTPVTDKATTVDDYIDRLPPGARDRLGEMRALVRSTAPELVEEMKWGSPAYLHPDGVIMLMLSAHQAHANVVFTPSTREHFAADLTGFDTGKGSVKVPYDVHVPADLFARMIRHRIREYEDDGVKWM